MERFEPVDACVTPVLTLQEALRHPLFTDHTRPQPWAAVAPTAIQPEHVSP
jgi:crotonobetainyl-CoA:carnitine CoA-transferase CaiB-like acyl-CoA transferase